MMTNKIWTIIAMFMVAISMNASAATLYEDSFESYTDSAAFAASPNWNVFTGSTPIVLKTDGGHTGSKYIQYSTVAFRQGHRFASTVPTDEVPITVSYWIRSDGVDGRSVLGVGSGTVSAIVEFGNYNAVSPDDSGWEARIVGGTPSPASWATIGGTRTANTWVNLKAVIKKRDVIFSVDNVVTATFSRTASDFPAIDLVYLGVGASSTVTNDFDDVSITTPSSDVSDWNLY